MPVLITLGLLVTIAKLCNTFYIFSSLQILCHIIIPPNLFYAVDNIIIPFL